MARRVKVDFTGVDSFTKCAEGEHIAICREIEEKPNNSGDDALVAKFEVIKGSSTGARLFENFTLTQKALWKLKQYREAIGLKAEGKLAIDLDQMIGKQVIIGVKHEPYQGQMRAKIDYYTEIKDGDEDGDEAGEDDAEEEAPAPPPKKQTPPAKQEPPKKPAGKKPEPPKKDDDDGDDEDWDET